MKKLIGVDKTIDEQYKILEKILQQSEIIKEILKRLEQTSLKNYYLCAGCINQIVFNYYHDKDLSYGINDYDIVYFDEDTSYEAEDVIIKEVSEKLKDLDVKFDIKNEARVHLWYNEKYHANRKPYTSLENAVSRWGTTITCIGVRLDDEKLKVFAPYGLNDLFSMTIRPIKSDFTKEQYEEKANKWKEKWPKLKIAPWNEESNYIMISTTFDNKEEADKIISSLLEKRLVSCCQVSNITSSYHWKGSIEKAEEFLVQMKSKKSLYKEIEQVILNNHSYEIPQIIAYDIVDGYKGYLDWIEEETK